MIGPWAELQKKKSSNKAIHVESDCFFFLAIKFSAASLRFISAKKETTQNKKKTWRKDQPWILLSRTFTTANGYLLPLLFRRQRHRHHLFLINFILKRLIVTTDQHKLTVTIAITTTTRTPKYFLCNRELISRLCTTPSRSRRRCMLVMSLLGISRTRLVISRVRTLGISPSLSGLDTWTVTIN